MKRKCSLIAAAFVAAFICVEGASAQQSTPVFPQKNGVRLYYNHYGSDKEPDATVVIEVRNVKGDFRDGGLDMVYFCKDEKGKPYFKGNNEFLLRVTRKAGQTHILMDDMTRTLKVADLITAGDVSSVCVPMTVGSTLPDSKIAARLGPFNATLTISEKKVLSRKDITVGGKVFDCYLVHEKIVTKTPFSTSTDTADSWYAEGAGVISQDVYNSKGRLKGKLVLTEVK